MAFKATTSSCLNFVSPQSQVVLTLVSLLILLCLPSSLEGALTLKPQTPVKEVFTGDSFVITCLSDPEPSQEYHLKWLNPDGREVPSAPTAPIYVTEKQEGLQIVFVRQNKKHSGVYKCLQVKTDTRESVAEITFEVKIYKSIEFHGQSIQTATEGEVYAVQCQARFDNEVTSASVVWDKTGRNIVNEDSDKYYVSETKPPNLKSTLHIKDVEKTDAGTYTCRATQFTPTISQFKQLEIDVHVNYKPKFSPNSPKGVWIDRQEFNNKSRGSIIEVNFTCYVDSDPRAELTWVYPNGRMVEVNPSREITNIEEKENMSVLKYRYEVKGDEITPSDEAQSGLWPPAGSTYQRPDRPRKQPSRVLIRQPTVEFECRAKNNLGSTSQRFPLRIGDMPMSPSLIDHSYTGNNLTLVLQQTPVDPPVDYYRIEFSDGVIVEFNASETTESPGTDYSSSESNNDNINNNLTYTVALNNVPSGHHRLVIYAHNPVGWSLPLKDPALHIRVINRASSRFEVSASLLVISFLIFFTGSSALFRDFSSSMSAKL